MAENDDKPRLIERGFCLKQASINSVHEKNVRHGHISTLHIWPARRPLTACRAALIATLLPDPGDIEKRTLLLERIGGKVVSVQKKSNKGGNEELRYIEETEGGILRWGRESESDINFFREEIRKAYGGRAPKVLDPFAGGGAIPLEAMRLGCETTSIDINPVAWFIEKCTLEYPQRLIGQKLPLPDFILENTEFMDSFYKAQGIKPSAGRKKQSTLTSFDGEKMVLKDSSHAPLADLAWHVRAWGWWVQEQAKNDLAKYYPVIQGKPTIAYLWARTVTCKNCRATIPLLKTRWLCKKEKKRVLLTIQPNSNRTSVLLEVHRDVPQEGHTKSEKTEKDKYLGQGTMSSSGAWCPCCGKPGTVAMTRDDIQNDIKAQYAVGKPKFLMTAVIVENESNKEYRLPVEEEIFAVEECEKGLKHLFENIPFGLPEERIEVDAKGSTWTATYGANRWYNQFNPRQLYTTGTLVVQTRMLQGLLKAYSYDTNWSNAIYGYLALCIDRVADRNCTLSVWQTNAEKVGHAFANWAIPMAWDHCEIKPWVDSSGGYLQAVDWVAEVAEHLSSPNFLNSKSLVLNESAISQTISKQDIIITDPPYYDAIPYSNLMDFFFVWLKRTLFNFDEDVTQIFNRQSAPKWNGGSNDGELVDDATRFGGDHSRSKMMYEDGMYRAFLACRNSLNPIGRLVVVFAHKQPDAWETFCSAIIRSGFVVVGSWPIQTERVGRTRSIGSAALSSSVWLVCKIRPGDAKPGWDNKVLEEMRFNIKLRLHEYWDSGIRGPDFIWAATGPALEAYSKHPIVKKANDPGQIMTISEFLVEVRRIVMDFVVGRVIGDEGERDRNLDNVTTYYLLHRHDFGFGDAPAGSCILYAVSCDLSDKDLAGEQDILLKSGGMEEPVENEEDGTITEDDIFEEGTSSTYRLKTWNKRKGKNLGIITNGRPAPMIDQVHKLMHLWKEGDITKVNEYLGGNGLLKNKSFHRILQAIIELSKEGDEERSLLESISNHIISRGGAVSAPRDLSNFGD